MHGEIVHVCTQKILLKHVLCALSEAQNLVPEIGFAVVMRPAPHAFLKRPIPLSLIQHSRMINYNCICNPSAYIFFRYSQQTPVVITCGVDELYEFIDKSRTHFERCWWIGAARQGAVAHVIWTTPADTSRPRYTLTKTRDYRHNCK